MRSLSHQIPTSNGGRESETQILTDPGSKHLSGTGGAYRAGRAVPIMLSVQTALVSYHWLLAGGRGELRLKPLKGSRGRARTWLHPCHLQLPEVMGVGLIPESSHLPQLFWRYPLNPKYTRTRPRI